MYVKGTAEREYLLRRPFLSVKSYSLCWPNLYNQRRIVLCVGQGRWEEEGRRTTALMGDVLYGKDIHAWVDFWGYDVDHDWDWWKKQFAYFLPFVLREQT